MSFNGSGTFVVNSSGQPVVTGTVISSTAFNALTADLATGLSTCVTKDGQTATTVRVPFAFGINSTLTTDATSATTGSIITAGGISTQKALWVGTTSRLVGAVTMNAALTYGGITLSNAVTGTGNMVLSASPTLTGTLTAAAITASGTLANSSYFRTGGATDANVVWNLGGTSIATGSGQSAVQIGYTFTSAATAVGNALYAWVRTEAAAFTMASAIGIQIANPSKGAGSAITTNYGLQIDNQTAGATNYAIYTSGGLHYFTGATTCASNVTATYFTPTATGDNGLGLAAASTPAFYASTTEVMRSTTALTTFALASTFASTIASGAITSTGAVTGTRLMIGADSGASYLLNVSGSSTSTGVRAIVINTSNNAGAVTLLQVQNDATYALQMKIYSSTSASPNVGEILAGGGNLTLGGQNTVGLTLGTSGAATFASSVTATLFTPTATGNNGLGLKGSNNPALYASTTEVANWTTTAFNILKDTAVTGALTATTMNTSEGSTSSMLNGATETIISLATTSNIVLVVVRWVSGGNYAAAICVRCGSDYVILNIGTTSGLTLVGGNGIIQVTNSSGATRSFSWTAIRMA